jgi:hypothetical protein
MVFACDRIRSCKINSFLIINRYRLTMKEYLALLIPSDVLNALLNGSGDHEILKLIKNRIDSEYGEDSNAKAHELLFVYKDLINERDVE